MIGWILACIAVAALWTGSGYTTHKFGPWSRAASIAAYTAFVGTIAIILGAFVAVTS